MAAASVTHDTEQQFRSITSGDIEFLEGLLNARFRGTGKRRSSF